MVASMSLLYQIPVAYCKLPDRDENSEASPQGRESDQLRAKISFFIRTHNGTRSIAAMRIHKPDCSAVTVQR
jgi:hypothetical protein